MIYNIWHNAPADALVFRDTLPRGDLFIFPISALDRAKMPSWHAALFAADGSVHHGHGAGQTHPQALSAAILALSERAYGANVFDDIPTRTTSYRTLVAQAGHAGVYHPWVFGVPAGSAVDEQSDLPWVRALRHPDRETVWLPLPLVPARAGLAAGRSRADALARGIIALLTRESLHAPLERRLLDVGGIADADIRAFRERLRTSSIAPVVRVATDDFQRTIITMTGLERVGSAATFPLTHAASGRASAVHGLSALRDAAIDYGAARSRLRFDHGPLSAVSTVAPGEYVGRIRAAGPSNRSDDRTRDAMAAWLALDEAQLRAQLETPSLDEQRADLSAFAPNGGNGTTLDGERRLAELVGLLAAHRLDVVYFDCTTPALLLHDVHVVKVVIPGLGADYLVDGRLPERTVAQLLRQKSPLIERSDGFGFKRIRLTPDAEDRLGGPVWLDFTAAGVALGNRLPLYREPDVHELALRSETGRMLGR